LALKPKKKAPVIIIAIIEQLERGHAHKSHFARCIGTRSGSRFVVNVKDIVDPDNASMDIERIERQLRKARLKRKRLSDYERKRAADVNT
jgi:hypothetical protein